MLFGLSPAFSALMGIAFLGEPLTWRIALGSVLMLVGAIIVTFDDANAFRTSPDRLRAAYRQ